MFLPRQRGKGFIRSVEPPPKVKSNYEVSRINREGIRVTNGYVDMKEAESEFNWLKTCDAVGAYWRATGNSKPIATHQGSRYV